MEMNKMEARTQSSESINKNNYSSSSNNNNNNNSDNNNLDGYLYIVAQSRVVPSPPPSPRMRMAPTSPCRKKAVTIINDKAVTVNKELHIQHSSDDMSGSYDLDLVTTGPADYMADDSIVSRRPRTNSYSSIKVEIEDVGWGEESINFTTSTLRMCKEQVLRPYWGLLTFIGWRGIRKESPHAHLLRWRVVNFVYTSIIILLLLYTYMYEVLACEWKLDLVKERQVIPAKRIVRPSPLPAPAHNTSVPNPLNVNSYPIIGHSHRVGGPNNSYQPLSPRDEGGCDHIGSTYVLPNVLHLLAYLMGLYYFRLQENEQLYALMEKVFLQASPLPGRAVPSQQKMVHRLRILLTVGSIWVFFTVIVQCIFLWAFRFPQMPLFTKIGKKGYWIMLCGELVGRTIFNSVILAIVMNYATQCEMIKFYVRGLVSRLQEKSTDLKAAMKDILIIRHSLGQLNGIISKMTSLVTFIMAELAIMGLCILFFNSRDDVKVWIYRGLFPFGWILMMVLPLWQAARVNSIWLRIHKISLEMRVFGYKGASILDLDSFLQFVTLIKPKAKLFHIPMMTQYLLFSLVIGGLVFIILLQTDSMGIGPGNIL